MVGYGDNRDLHVTVAFGNGTTGSQHPHTGRKQTRCSCCKREQTREAVAGCVSHGRIVCIFVCASRSVKVAGVPEYIYIYILVRYFLVKSDRSSGMVPWRSEAWQRDTAVGRTTAVTNLVDFVFGKRDTAKMGG